MKFGKILLVAAGGTAALGAAQIAAQAPASELSAGKWRASTSFSHIEIPNLPPQVANMMQSRLKKGHSVDTCITPEQASKPSPEAFGARKNSDCKYDKFSLVGNRLDIEMVCRTGGGTMRSKVNGTFSGQSYLMNVDTTISGQQTGAMRMKGQVSGKRIGDC